MTHVIVAAFHINDDPAAITLNDDHPLASMYDELWSEIRTLRGKGIKVLGMLGGAAKGSYERLTGDEDQVRFFFPHRTRFSMVALVNLCYGMSFFSSLVRSHCIAIPHMVQLNMI